jgi:hypothetical protein
MSNVPASGRFLLNSFSERSAMVASIWAIDNALPLESANRITASRLQQISHILQVPLAFFFEGAPNALA